MIFFFENAAKLVESYNYKIEAFGFIDKKEKVHEIIQQITDILSDIRTIYFKELNAE